MNSLQWKTAARSAGALLIGASLVFAACSKVDTKETIQPAEAKKEADRSPAVRTAEVFDTKKYKDKLTVRYFYLESDTKSGDCILITTPDGKTMLIDSGLPEAGPRVDQYLNKLGIDTIDIALNTHPHSDHIGGYGTILLTKNVKQFYMENLPYPNSNSYNNAMSAIKKKNIPVTYLEEGSTFELGGEVKAELLSPAKGSLPGSIKTFEAGELNNESMVIKLTYKDNTFLFPADIYKEREYKLVEQKEKQLDADFVHAPHHGGETSSSPSFVRAVSPQVAVLSANIFQSLTIMQRYEKYEAKAYSTGLDGNILIVSDGKKLEVITEKDRKSGDG